MRWNYRRLRKPLFDLSPSDRIRPIAVHQGYANPYQKMALPARAWAAGLNALRPAGKAGSMTGHRADPDECLEMQIQKRLHVTQGFKVVNRGSVNPPASAGVFDSPSPLGKEGWGAGNQTVEGALPV